MLIKTTSTFPLNYLAFISLRRKHFPPFTISAPTFGGEGGRARDSAMPEGGLERPSRRGAAQEWSARSAAPNNQPFTLSERASERVRPARYAPNRVISTFYFRYSNAARDSKADQKNVIRTERHPPRRKKPFNVRSRGPERRTRVPPGRGIPRCNGTASSEASQSPSVASSVAGSRFSFLDGGGATIGAESPKHPAFSRQFSPLVKVNVSPKVKTGGHCPRPRKFLDPKESHLNPVPGRIRAIVVTTSRQRHRTRNVKRIKILNGQKTSVGTTKLRKQTTTFDCILSLKQ